MNTRNLILAAAGAAATFAAVAPAAAQQWRWDERGWRTIGYTRVDGRDSDRIRLPGVTRQREIRLCAMNAPLRLRDFDIRFANGGRQDVNDPRGPSRRPLHPRDRPARQPPRHREHPPALRAVPRRLAIARSSGSRSANRATGKAREQLPRLFL